MPSVVSVPKPSIVCATIPIWTCPAFQGSCPLSNGRILCAPLTCYLEHCSSGRRAPLAGAAALLFFRSQLTVHLDDDRCCKQIREFLTSWAEYSSSLSGSETAFGRVLGRCARSSPRTVDLVIAIFSCSSHVETLAAEAPAGKDDGQTLRSPTWRNFSYPSPLTTYTRRIQVES